MIHDLKSPPSDLSRFFQKDIKTLAGCMDARVLLLQELAEGKMQPQPAQVALRVIESAEQSLDPARKAVWN